MVYVLPIAPDQTTKAFFTSVTFLLQGPLCVLINFKSHADYNCSVTELAQMTLVTV